MKDTISFRAVIGTASAVFALAATSVPAQTFASAQPPPYAPPPPGYAPPPNNDYGFYVGADAGPSWVQDFRSPRFGYQANIRTDPGVRLGIEPGFNFIADNRLTVGAEFETGVIYNHIRNFDSGGASPYMQGDLYQVPVLGNLVLKLHPDPMITPFIGVGGGGDYSDIELRHHFFGTSDYNDRFDPALQGIVGVRFRINPMTDLGVEYKYLADFPDHGTVIETHAVMASFTVKF